MSNGEPMSACPQPNVLAAFADGSLEGTARADMEQHLAHCRECAHIVAETVLLLSEIRTMQRARRVWLFAAMLALSVVAIVLHVSLRERDLLAPLRDAMLVADDRPVEGWLTRFPYAPFRRSRSTTHGPIDIEIRVPAETIAETASRRASAQHARGVALLVLGDPAGAIAALQTASRREPQDPTIWNDLAVANTAAAAAEHDQRRLRAGAAAADLAIALAPSFAEAHFNRGVALEALGETDEADRSYRRALALLPPSGWRSEIEERLRR